MLQQVTNESFASFTGLTCNGICSLIYLLCLIYTFSRKKLNISYNVCYTLTLIVLTFGVCYDAAKLVVNENQIILEDLEFVLRSIGSVLLLFYTFLYIRAASDTYVHLLSLRAFIVIYSLMLVTYFVIISSHEGTRLLEVCVTVFIFFILWCVVTIHMILYFKKLSRLEKITLFTGKTLIIATIVLNQINSEFAASGVYLISSLTVLIYYISLQNPTNHKDTITGLLNFDSFMQYVAEQMDTYTPFYVVSLTIKHFKGLNSLYGAEICNKYLAKVAKILSVQARKGEVFRLYGANFIIVYHKEAQVKRFCSSIESIFSEALEVNNFLIRSELKTVIMSYPKDAQDPQMLYELLDFTTKNSNTALSEDIAGKLNRQILVERALRRCIADQSITIVYQPIYNANKRRFTSAEALARIDDPVLGRLSPSEFIPIAEGNGLIVQLGLQIIQKVCKFIKEKDIKQYGINYIEVNVSPLQCAQSDFAANVIHVVKSMEVPVEMLNFEITETATNNSADAMKENLKQLASAGFVFSLDDYGTCSSNLENMLTFPFKCIKLDRCLVQAYVNKESQILPFLIVMLKNDGYQIIAEGAETMSQAKVLIRMGVDYIQGYCYSKPLDVIDYIDYVKARNEGIIDNEDDISKFDVTEALKLVNSILNQEGINKNGVKNNV